MEVRNTHVFLNVLNLKDRSMPLPVGIKFHLPPEFEDLRRVLRSCVACSASVFEEKIGVVDEVSRAQLEDAILVDVLR